MSVSRESLEGGLKTLVDLETVFPDATQIEIASGVCRVAFEGGFFDDKLYIPRNPTITDIQAYLAERTGQNQQAGAVETPFEWTYGVMALAGIKPLHPLASKALELTFRIDPGISGKEINRKFGDLSSGFWFSIGGELLQCHLRRYARVRELRLATLGLISALELKDGRLLKLSQFYERTVDAYSKEPLGQESDLMIIANELVAPKFGQVVLRTMANTFPYLERTGLVPISRQALKDRSDVIEWPRPIHSHQDYVEIAELTLDKS
jgi:hypothetical protein